MRLAAVKNDLESFSYEVKNKLYEEEFETCSTEEEREEIRSGLSTIIDWYDEAPNNTPLEVRPACLMVRVRSPGALWVVVQNIRLSEVFF